MDINRALRLAISTGNVKLGMAQANKSITGKAAKLIIVANNCPKGIVSTAKTEEVPTYRFRGNNRELGAACGKPFSISTVTILEEGQSEILALQPETPAEIAAAAADPEPVADSEPVLTETVEEPIAESEEILEGVPTEE